MRTLMNLGGNYYQMSLVKEAKRMGIKVIDVDYLPNNPAHKYADEYFNISVTEKDEILKLAKEKHIDGITSFASDVGAITAAYVAEKMGLPTNPYHTVEMMTRKDLFHPFLKRNGFVVPEVAVVDNEQDINHLLDKYPKLLIKPVDSSGSKGITLLEEKSKIAEAFELAMKYAGGGHIIAEEFIEKKGYQISGDIFVVNGEVKNWGFANGHRDETCNPLVPIGDSFPVSLELEKQEIMKNEIQRAINALGYRNGPINVEFVFDIYNRPIIIELGPRSGGGLLADIIYMASGVDIISYCVKAALGDDLSGIRDDDITRNISAYEFHSRENGIFQSLELSEEIKNRMLGFDYFIEPGEKVYRGNDSGKAIGVGVLEFDTVKEMLTLMDSMENYYKVNFEEKE